MAEVVRFDVVGLLPEDLHLPRTVDKWERLDHYLIHGLRHDGPLENVRHWSSWRVLVVGRSSQAPPLRYLRLFNIDGDEVDLANFTPWNEASGTISLGEAELRALREFLAQMSDDAAPLMGAVPSITYFMPASPADLIACGIPPDLVARAASLLFETGKMYLYHPDNSVLLIQAERTWTFLWVSKWSSPEHLAGTVGIGIFSYSAERIAQLRQAWSEWLSRPDGHLVYDPRLIDGESSLLLTGPGLREWAGLLDERLEQPNQF